MNAGWVVTLLVAIVGAMVTLAYRIGRIDEKVEHLQRELERQAQFKRRSA